MAEIVTGSGVVILLDESCVESMGSFRWQISSCKRHSTKYAFTTIGGHTVYMHRMVMQAPRGSHVDHIDGNGLNNQRGNLRLCTPSQNSQNSRIKANTQSCGYRGVQFHSPSNKFRPTIWVKKKTIRRGYYKSAKEAAIVRDRMALEVYGEFAVLNFPELAEGRA